MHMWPNVNWLRAVYEPLSRPVIAAAAMVLITAACTPQLVAPYNSDLQQRASTLQSEIGAWDLATAKGAGTVLADPRHPDIIAALSKWRGDAGAMLTLAISNDVAFVNCGEAVQPVRSLIEGALPESLKDTAKAARPAPKGGCEVQLVAGLMDGIDAIETALQYCHLDWVDDSYFADLTRNRTTSTKPAAAPTPDRQRTVAGACGSEFRHVAGVPAHAAEYGHGRAVSKLLTTVQAIVYIETRKKATSVTAQ